MRSLSTRMFQKGGQINPNRINYMIHLIISLPNHGAFDTSPSKARALAEAVTCRARQ